MKKSELKKALKNFADNGISHSESRLNEVLTFQDIIGRSNFNEIFEAYHDMDKFGRGIFLWVSCTCLDKDMFLEILKKCVCESIIHNSELSYQKIIDEKLQAITAREENMQDLEISNAVNVEKIRCLELELDISRDQLSKARVKAASFDTIKNLLK